MQKWPIKLLASSIGEFAGTNSGFSPTDQGFGMPAWISKMRFKIGGKTSNKIGQNRTWSMDPPDPGKVFWSRLPDFINEL